MLNTRSLLATAHRRAISAAYDAGFRPAPTTRDLLRTAVVSRRRMPDPEKQWRVRIRPEDLPHDALTSPKALKAFHHDCVASDAYEARAKAWNAWADRAREDRL
jgi:hypothetical protein